jgi:ADP-ribose pyrophosphatase YjhB (NUDIX family)
MIRVSAKAVIIRDDKLLVIACHDSAGDFYLLPGGGQDKFESLADAVRRECREEIATDVEVGDVLFVRDYIGRNHEFADTEQETHAVEVMFACRVPDDYTPTRGAVPDPWQHGVTWIALDELPRVRLYPAALSAVLAARTSVARYLGDVN